MPAGPGPYSWEPHLAAWLLVAAGVGAVVFDHWRLQRSATAPVIWPPHRIRCFAVAVAGMVIAFTWPLADLAAHWSLTALVVQRLLLLLFVAPMLVLGLPDDVLAHLTRPAIVDAILAQLQRPPVAVAVVTAVSIGSMTPPLVRAQATSVVARGLLDAAVLAAGLVLWLPVIGRLPGVQRPKPVVRFGYLVFQAVVPAFLSFVYIFSRHPLYDTFSRSTTALGIRPLTDQQVAGFVSKLSMLIVMLSVGSVVLARASRSDDDLALEGPLVWTDVERAFERADRRRGREPGSIVDPVDGGRLGNDLPAEDLPARDRPTDGLPADDLPADGRGSNGRQSNGRRSNGRQSNGPGPDGHGPGPGMHWGSGPESGRPAEPGKGRTGDGGDGDGDGE